MKYTLDTRVSVSRDAVKKVTRWFVESALTIIGAWLLIGAILIMTIQAVLDHRRISFDSTDGATERSGLEIKTDCQTRLQYLVTSEGGITPRLAADGTHMRGSSAYCM